MCEEDEKESWRRDGRASMKERTRIDKLPDYQKYMIALEGNYNIHENHEFLEKQEKIKN